MKKSQVNLALAFVAGAAAFYLLQKSGVVSAPLKLGQSGPYHNYPPPYPAISAVKVF